MKGSIFNIQSEYLELMEVLEETGGELTEELEQRLQITKEALFGKSEQYANIIRKLQADASIIKEEENRLAAIRKAKENAVSGLKETLKNAMEMFDVRKLEHPFGKVWVQNNPPAYPIEDVELLPSDYRQEVITYKPLMDKIKETIKAGGTVKGVEFRQGTHLRIK